MIKTNSTHHIALSKALIQLEADMYQDGIWPNEEPAEQDLNNAMESAVPFAVDCLAFESWFNGAAQWIGLRRPVRTYRRGIRRSDAPPFPRPDLYGGDRSNASKAG